MNEVGRNPTRSSLAMSVKRRVSKRERRREIDLCKSEKTTQAIKDDAADLSKYFEWIHLVVTV